MAVVHIEESSGSQTGVPVQVEGPTAGQDGAAAVQDVPTILAPHTSLALSKLDRATDSQTIEIRVDIAEARGLIVAAVTTDNELRAIFTRLLSSNGIVFFDSPEQALAQPVPNNCAILIVERTVGRPKFERLKAHFSACAPALVSIMIGSDDDGSSLVRLLSAGHIDRFMVKPLNAGPTRNALRSALQQFRSTRSHAHATEAAVPNVVSLESARVHASSGHTRKRGTVGNHSPKSSSKSREGKNVASIARPPIMKLRTAEAAEPGRNAQFAQEKEVERFFESQSKSRADTVDSRRQLSLPSWSLACVAVIAMLGFIAWGISTRSPALNANKEIAGHLAAAQRAFEMGHFVEPPELSAAHFFAAALELDPKNVAAAQGLDAIANRLIGDSRDLIAAGDLLRAQSTLDNVRRIRPSHRDLAEVNASLLRARDAERFAIQAGRSVTEQEIETISISPQPVVEPATPVLAKSSTLTPPKIKIVPQRRERQLQADTNAPARKESPSTTSKSAPSSERDLVRDARLDSAALQARAEPSKSIASVSNEGAAPVEPKTASAVEVSAAEPAKESAVAPAATHVLNSVIGASNTQIQNGASEPTLIKYIEPTYPFKARATGAEGWLDVYFLVRSDGTVIAPRVEQGTLGNEFRRAAVAAVSQWKYSSAPNAATPSRPMNVRLRFKLEG